jgi:hypothetical protein
VPGGLYQLRTSVGKPEPLRTAASMPGVPAPVPVIDETLTLISVTPKQP